MREENARLWQQQSPAQQPKKRTRSNWYDDRYRDNPEIYNYEFAPTLSDSDYRSDGIVNWY